MNLGDIQSQSLSVLSKHLVRGDKVALLDYPRHQNAGDALIWLGARQYLKMLGVEVAYIASLNHFSARELRKRVPDGPILINGGGNFGDRWVESQAFKESVIAQFPDRKIVQLPQTMEFNTNEGLARAQAVYGSHPDVTILMRDRVGFAAAKRAFPNNNVEFCPDMALGYGYHKRGKAKYSLVFLKRNDNESVQQDTPLLRGPSYKIVDWGFRGTLRVPAWRALRLAEDVVRVFPKLTPALYPLIELSFAAMAEANVRSASRILSEGNVVVTDRLHAMVLAALLGIPVYAYDNANKKVSAIFKDYVGELPNVFFAEDAATAINRGLDYQPTSV
ncbi:polysaccharide pyruvyl transferase family protein [Arthrobacter sp. NPDC093125]|uniref:polysaccharide pyruvyl transferase family protein n=1 Tax=Arthrobacter sp. NPDC093125 TaxID=3363944 RepID=UPI00382890E8